MIRLFFELCYYITIWPFVMIIKLDTMFVDEGFGSLDDESLQQAMQALSSLTESNRLVGIISHVADLKDRIDKQIIVRKEKSGGSKAEVII